jgi:hypothetical protein
VTEDDYSQAETRRAIERIDRALEGLSEKFDQVLGNYITKEKYESDDKTRIEIRAGIVKQVDEIGEAVTNLQGDATRRARERKNMWVVITCAVAGAFIPALTALLISFNTQGHTTTANCVSSPLTPSVVSCTFPAK